MKISLDWLRDFVTWEGDAESLASLLTMAGINVEGREEFTIALPGVVVAHVRETARHPQADKLTLCQVWDGEQTLSVVCGAPNVRADQKVLLARPGAVLPGGAKIKVSRIRGVESQGMICSARELGLGGDEGGIMELPAAAPPGTAADALYGFRDQILDLEITPNRPDLLGHFGVAREIAALTGAMLTAPALWTPPKTSSERLEWSVEIESFADCPRYTAHLARGVKLGPAPDFMRNRLLAVGQRPINNVVDITNYVMLELGQPLHAFDRGKLSGTRLVVRRAGQEREFTALDGQTRHLDDDHLIIADSAGAVALAGIVGGSRSEVDASTQEVLLESAFFDPLVVRRGARKLGLVTDSSYRFEREADWNMVEKAAWRALHLLQQHAGARIVPDRVDRQNPDRESLPPIPLRIAQVNRLLGTEIETTEAVQLLQALDLTVVPLGQARNRKSGSANVMIEVPSFRRDLRAEVDLVEEIARLRGFDRLPTDPAARGARAVAPRALDKVRRRVRAHLSAVGYSEIVTSSFLAREDLERLGLADGDARRNCLSVRNARLEGETLLRTTLLPSLLRILRHNLNADLDCPLRLFQLNRVFWPGARGAVEPSRPQEDQLPAEPLFLQLAVAGRTESTPAGLPAGLWEVKGVVETLGGLIGWSLEARPGDSEPYGALGRQWRLEEAGSGPVGWAGELDGAVLAGFGIEAPVCVAEVDLTSLPAVLPSLAVRPFSRFPAVKRDLSLLVPDGVTFAELAAVIRERGGDCLESLELFDYYRGKGIPAGAAALGIRLKFRSAKGNLKGTTVDKSLALVTEELAARFGAQLRA